MRLRDTHFRTLLRPRSTHFPSPRRWPTDQLQARRALIEIDQKGAGARKFSSLVRDMDLDHPQWRCNALGRGATKADNFHTSAMCVHWWNDTAICIGDWIDRRRRTRSLRIWNCGLQLKGNEIYVCHHLLSGSRVAICSCVIIKWSTFWQIVDDDDSRNARAYDSRRLLVTRRLTTCLWTGACNKPIKNKIRLEFRESQNFDVNDVDFRKCDQLCTEAWRQAIFAWCTAAQSARRNQPVSYIYLMELESKHLLCNNRQPSVKIEKIEKKNRLYLKDARTLRCRFEVWLSLFILFKVHMFRWYFSLHAVVDWVRNQL